MKRWVGVTLFFCSGVWAQTRGELTLDQALEIGSQNSRALLVAASRSEAAEARYGEINANRLPSLRFYGGYTRVSEGQFKIFDSAMFPFFRSPSVVPDNYTFRVGVTQPLFTGLRLANQAEAAELQSTASRLEEKMAEAELRLNVTSAYWSLFQAFQAKEYVDENVTRLESHVRDTERMLKAGLVTRNDLLKLEVQLANARLSQIDARDEVSLATMNLNNILGRSLDTEIRTVSTPENAPPADSVLVLERDDFRLRERAWGLRPDLQSLAFQREAARKNASAARGAYWPQVDLTASYSYLRPNQRYQPITPEFLGSWDVGVQLQFDVWNWGKTSRQAEQADALLKQTDLQYAQMKDNIVLEVQRAALVVRRSKEKLGVAALAVAQAEENRRTTDERYHHGLATSSELLDAEVALLQAKMNRTGALVELALAKARLLRAMGS
jgi:outer membrane protein